MNLKPNFSVPTILGILIVLAALVAVNKMLPDKFKFVQWLGLTA